MSTAATLFSLSVVFVLYTALGYPLLTFLLARIVNLKRTKAPVRPSVSLIIAAYNEERVIGEKIENSLALNYPKDKLDIVVASDGSTDRTDEIVLSYAEQGVRLIRTIGRIGKSATMNEVVPQTTGEILVFSDATTVFHADTVRHMVSNFADPAIGGVSGRIVFKYDNSIMARGLKVYYAFSVLLRINESRFGGISHLTGAIHAIRRSCFEPCPRAVSPELWHVTTLARRRFRAVYECEALGHELARSRANPEFQARVRNCHQVFTFLGLLVREHLFSVSPLYLFQLLSHRVLRWLLPLLLAVILITSIVLAASSSGFAMIAMAQIILYLTGVSGLLVPGLAGRIPGVSFVSYFLVFLAATTVGAVKAVVTGSRTGWHTERSDEKTLFGKL